VMPLISLKNQNNKSNNIHDINEGIQNNFLIVINVAMFALDNPLNLSIYIYIFN
jgi:hypothetical protein